MVAPLVAEGGSIRLGRTCAMARGLADVPLIDGVAIGTLPELADGTREANKVLTF